MAAAGSESMEGLEPEKSAAKRKRKDSVEAVEGLEHDKSAEVEEEKGGLSVDEDEERWTPLKGECSVDEYENWVGPYRPPVVRCRNDEERARLKKIMAENQAKRDAKEEPIDQKQIDDYRRYKEQIDKSDGFDIDFVIRPPFLGAIYPIEQLKDEFDYSGMADTSLNFAIKNYNEQHQDHEKLELVGVEKANVLTCAGLYFLITFKAKNIATSEVKTYQAQVDYKFGNAEHFKVPIFREKPKPAN